MKGLFGNSGKWSVSGGTTLQAATNAAVFFSPNHFSLQDLMALSEEFNGRPAEEEQV